MKLDRGSCFAQGFPASCAPGCRAGLATCWGDYSLCRCDRHAISRPATMSASTKTISSVAAS